MILQPLHDRLLVRPYPAEERSAGGIILPDAAQERPVKGTVIAAGPGKRDEQGVLTPMSVQVLNTILYGKYSGTEVTVDGEDLLIMRETDVFAIITPDNPATPEAPEPSAASN